MENIKEFFINYLKEKYSIDEVFDELDKEILAAFYLYINCKTNIKSPYAQYIGALRLSKIAIQRFLSIIATEIHLFCFFGGILITESTSFLFLRRDTHHGQWFSLPVKSRHPSGFGLRH